MTFSKYSSLENHYRQGFVNKLIDSGLTGGTWVCTEKVHGANYSFWFNGTEHKRAKRSGFVGGDEVFYSDDRIQKYQHGVEETYMKMCMAGLVVKGDWIVVYGEIFGGNFFGQKANGAKQVQKGVNYHPDVEFMAFDLGVSSEGSVKMVSWKLMNDLLSRDIPQAPVVKIGTFQECLETDNEFNSLVPEVFGLELTEEVINTCEGFVMKPMDSVEYLANGNRAIIKSKNSKFSEKSDKKVAKVPEKLPEEISAPYSTLVGYLVEERLRSVLSKIGEVSQKDFGKLVGLMSQDAIIDFEKDLESTAEEIFGDHKKSVGKMLNKEASNVVREHWVNILDGEF